MREDTLVKDPLALKGKEFASSVEVSEVRETSTASAFPSIRANGCWVQVGSVGLL